MFPCFPASLPPLTAVGEFTQPKCYLLAEYCGFCQKDVTQSGRLMQMPALLPPPLVVLRMVGAIPDCQIAGSTSLTLKWPFLPPLPLLPSLVSRTRSVREEWHRDRWWHGALWRGSVIRYFSGRFGSVESRSRGLLHKIVCFETYLPVGTFQWE